MTVKRIKQVPPQVQINLGNVQFPQLTLPALPAQITQEQLNQLIAQIVTQVIQSSLNQTVAVAIQQLLLSMPDAGFQQFDVKSGWIREN